ncbi:LicD family protein [Lactococcus cremoris]|uniref:LicD family protein n=1 Tax=Lactococcus lactis subsp. cremoris TaxID=1359 RepID=UPI002FC5D893
MIKNINELHEIDLEILKEFLKICENNNLQYFMIGGTFLGAIRHQGFIPWDDDIDIAMPREDYEKFLKFAPTLLPNYLKINNFKTNPEYHYYITRIINTKFPTIEKRIGNDGKNTFVSIDIFPIDGTPNQKIYKKIYYIRILWHRALMSLCYRDSIDRDRKRKKTEQIVLSILQRIPFEKFTSAIRQKNIIDKLLKEQKIETSDEIGTIMGAYRLTEIVPKRYFGKGKLYKFEDLELYGPELSDEYLTHMYGNYMQIPPVSEQKIHFQFQEQEKRKE